MIPLSQRLAVAGKGGSSDCSALQKPHLNDKDDEISSTVHSVILLLQSDKALVLNLPVTTLPFQNPEKAGVLHTNQPQAFYYIIII